MTTASSVLGRVGASVVLGGVLAAAVLGAGTADAAPTDVPNWHISALGIDKLHAAGFIGKGGRSPSWRAVSTRTPQISKVPTSNTFRCRNSASTHSYPRNSSITEP